MAKNSYESIAVKASDVKKEPGPVGQAVRDIGEPIVNFPKYTYEEIDRAAKTGAERYVKAGNPLTKAMATTAFSLKTIASPVNAAFRSATEATGEALERVPGYNQLVSALDNAAEPAIKAIAPALKKIVQLYQEKVPNWQKDIVEGAANIPVARSTLTVGRPIAKALGATVKGVTSGADKVLGKLSAEMSGVPEDALRMASTKQGRVAMQAAAGRQNEIGQDIVKMLERPTQYLPEGPQIEAALQRMPDVPMTNTIRALDAARVPDAVGVTKEMNKAINKLRTDMQRLGPNLPASRFRQLRTQLDKQISWDAPYKGDFNDAMKGVRRAMKDDLINAAQSSGNPEYVELMKTYANKLDAIDEAKKVFGASSQTRDFNAETVIRNIFNKNKTERRAAIQRIDDIFGSKNLEKANAAHMAEGLGPTGEATFLPVQSTGRSVAMIAGAPMTAGGTIAVGSPKVITRATLPASQTLANVGKRVSDVIAPSAPMSRAFAKGVVTAPVASILNRMESDIDVQPPEIQAVLKMRQAGTITDEMAMRLIANKQKSAQTLGQVGR